MKIAVTSQDQKHVTGPACTSMAYLIYETQDGKIADKQFIRLTQNEIFSNFKGCLSQQENHPLKGIDCLIATSLGTGLNQRLKDDGIQTIATNSADPDGAVLSIIKYI